jgi:hypothetical protein
VAPLKVALNITVWRLAGRGRCDVVDVVDEAHVEHAVGFVEHQHLDVLEHGLAGTEVVDQAAGGGDEDVQRAAQGLQLGRVGHAADDGGHAQARHVAAVVHGGLGHLHGQFTRRAQHQHTRAARASKRRGRSKRGSRSRHSPGAAAGASGLGAAALAARALSTSVSAGRMKLAVLPLPVRLLTIRSLPASAAGMASACTEVGSV